MLIVAGPVGASEHDPGRHPEHPGRLGAVMEGVDDLHLGTDLRSVELKPAEMDQLARVHDRDFLEWLAVQGPGHLDADTYMTPDSWETARRAAGAGLGAIEAVRASGGGVAFVAVRPPGHHAESHRAMGFCLLNNAAVSAAELVAAGERVLIVDWDVHHGNGTQEIFWDNPDVLYLSVHQSPLYPGTGHPEEVGGPNAIGTTLNLAVPPGTTGDVVRRALEEVAGPVIERFAPTWVLVSAGFDAHRDDPLANLELSAGDFADLARTIRSYGSSNIVVFLEGGYNLPALRASVTASLGAFLGADVHPESPTSGGPGNDALDTSWHAYEDALE
jgi:acetoin utilization deacetylase AcuC-like enzyme